MWWKKIEQQWTILRTPQKNEVVKGRNRTLLEMVKSMMTQANLPITYWGDALFTTMYVPNHLPSMSIKTTPYELWTKGQVKTLLEFYETLGLCYLCLWFFL